MFEITADDISLIGDEDLRTLVGLLASRSEKAWITDFDGDLRRRPERDGRRC